MCMWWWYVCLFNTHISSYQDNDVPLQIALEWGHTNVVQFMVVEAKVDTKQLDQVLICIVNTYHIL